MKWRILFAIVTVVTVISAMVTMCGPKVEAQDLPGPASKGWYIMIVKFRSQVTFLNCQGYVLAADKVNSMITLMENMGNDPMVRTFGPLDSERVAASKLASAGWTLNPQWGYWAASSCD